jgi:tRNA1(Val) A37 N6-methylase TrmN6
VAGLIKPARRPEGWSAPGPAPRGAQGRPELFPFDDEELSYLTGDWRLFQKQRGHRWSLDDLITAWVAGAHVTALGATRLLDLGCGLGSVLLMNAWRFVGADVTGVEAQADRAAMGRRSIAWNGAEDRCRIIDGDLRDPALLPAGSFELITGTPPYFPAGAGTASEKPHAFPCRFEVRGGVEDYTEAAARLLTPGGRFVVCTSALERERVQLGARECGLVIIEHTELVPREGKPVLICVDVMAHTAPEPCVARTFTVRDAASQWTPWFRGVRADMGMPTEPPRR